MKTLTYIYLFIKRAFKFPLFDLGEVIITNSLKKGNVTKDQINECLFRKRSF